MSVAVVTGARGGIGSATVRAFGEAGFDVHGVDVGDPNPPDRGEARIIELDPEPAGVEVRGLDDDEARGRPRIDQRLVAGRGGVEVVQVRPPGSEDQHLALALAEVGLVRHHARRELCSGAPQRIEHTSDSVSGH